MTALPTGQRREKDHDDDRAGAHGGAGGAQPHGGRPSTFERRDQVPQQTPRQEPARQPVHPAKPREAHTQAARWDRLTNEIRTAAEPWAAPVAHPAEAEIVYLDPSL